MIGMSLLPEVIVAVCMGIPLPTVPPDSPADAVRELVGYGRPVLVMEDGAAVGIAIAEDRLMLAYVPHSECL